VKPHVGRVTEEMPGDSALYICREFVSSFVCLYVIIVSIPIETSSKLKVLRSERNTGNPTDVGSLFFKQTEIHFILERQDT
jgi:hypothetical protein